MDFISSADFWNNIGVVGLVVFFGLLVITDKLVWHTRLKRANDRADKWERVALDALVLGAQAGVKAAEVTADVVSALPDPTRPRETVT